MEEEGEVVVVLIRLCMMRNAMIGDSMSSCPSALDGS